MKKISIVLIISILLGAFRFTDDPIIERIIAQLQKYTYHHPQEKVYLHFDKPYYMTGETMWFKAYLLMAFDRQPDTLSRVLYVDLVDNQDNKVICHKQLKVGNGTAHAEFDLPDTLTTNLVRVRAYTNWMRNFSDEMFFDQTFRVFKSKEPPAYDEDKIRKLAEIADFQLFPESGNLVTGIESRVGFKAVNALGRGLDVEGYVLENEKDTVAAFQSLHLGMGYFSFMPEAGKKYAARIKQADGKEKSVNLPIVLPSGFVMNVDNLSNKDNIKVYVFNNVFKPNEPAIQMALVAQQSGQICHAVKASVNKRGFVLNIPRAEIPNEGVVQVTLFDAQGVPVCERIVYENKNDGLVVEVSSGKQVYKTREKVQLNVKVADAGGKPVQGNFSIAVTDGTQVSADPHAGDIHTYFSLTSDVSPLISPQAYFSEIQGAVEQANYYFDSKNENSKAHLDVLMMTQGWRRFVWKELMNETTLKPRYYAEAGLSVTGTVLRPNGKTSDKPLNLTLFLSKGEDKQFLMGETDADGLFGFYALDFSDTTDVLIQAVKTSGGRNLNIRLDDWVSPKVQITKVPYNPMEFNRQDLENFLKRSKEMLEIEQQIKLSKTQQLKEVTIKAKKNEAETDSRKIYGRADNTITVDNQMCAGAFNVLSLIQGRVAGVQVVGSGMDMSVQIRGAANLQGPVSPLFLMDGMAVDLQTITSIPPCNVESIDILKGASAAIFGSRAYGGVISILTRRGGQNYDTFREDTPGIVTTKRLGYAIAREFYAPNYDDPKPEERYRPDFRSTIYWNANVQTDENGIGTIHYWNTDAKATINVRLEGINQQGKVGVGRYSYQVQ